MTAPHVLVAYCSKNGSTAEIAEWIGGALRDRRLTVDVLPAGQAGDIAPYDAVLLGSPLYMGRWCRDAVRFARRHRRVLLRRPLWLFSSGPLDASAGERDIPPVPGVARIAARLDARDHVTFGGRLVEGAQGFIARQILQQGKGGDFRDPERIRQWAYAVAAELVSTTETI